MLRLCGSYETSEYVVGSLCKHCVALYGPTIPETGYLL